MHPPFARPKKSIRSNSGGLLHTVSDMGSITWFLGSGNAGGDMHADGNWELVWDTDLEYIRIGIWTMGIRMGMGMGLRLRMGRGCKKRPSGNYGFRV